MSHGFQWYDGNKIFQVQKNRLIQACPIQVKDKSVQTSTDDNVLKQLEQKDKRISELEKSQLKAKKQIDKNSKLEKEISELRAINLRQSKELESVKSMKKKHKVWFIRYIFQSLHVLRHDYVMILLLRNHYVMKKMIKHRLRTICNDLWRHLTSSKV